MNATDVQAGNRPAQESTSVNVNATGNHVVLGIAGIVLGILAVSGLDSLVLLLVALGSLGAAALFSGATWSASSVATLAQK